MLIDQTRPGAALVTSNATSDSSGLIRRHPHRRGAPPIPGAPFRRLNAWPDPSSETSQAPRFATVPSSRASFPPAGP
jgi:hypothetical protein